MEVTSVGIPKGLVRCGQCGELRGRRIKCLREGIVCRYCKKNAIRKIPVKVENLIATPKYRNMWTHGRGLLRQSHAIL